ncbi:MAG: hypothetical protein ACP5HM_05650 [Anaerolineae bacterium]
MSAAWTLEIGEVRLRLSGPAARIRPFAAAWDTWSNPASGWNVELIEDPGLCVPQAPYFAARPRFENGCCLLTTMGFQGEIHPAAGRAKLRLHPAANDGDVAYFIRTVFALAAFEQQKLLFHAAGLVHHGQVYALFGHSGSGKTTAARLSRGKPVLSDDLLLLAPGEDGVDVWATPFGRRRHPDLRVAPLHALLQLIQAPEDRMTPVPQSEALGTLVANSPVVNADAGHLPALLEMWSQILLKVSTHRLYFRKAQTFWEVIDAYLR